MHDTNTVKLKQPPLIVLFTPVHFLFSFKKVYATADIIRLMKDLTNQTDALPSLAEPLTGCRMKMQHITHNFTELT